MPGIGAALEAAGINVFASNREEAKLVTTLRRSKLFLEEECDFNFVVFDADFGVIGEIVVNDETAMPSIEEVTAIVSSERSFMVDGAVARLQHGFHWDEGEAMKMRDESGDVEGRRLRVKYCRPAQTHHP